MLQGISFGNRGMTETELSNHRTRALKASKWGTLLIALPKIITPLITVVLAHFLTPEDYGVVAIAALVVGLASIFHGMAISQALIQTEDDIVLAANSCFWLSAFLGGGFTLLIFFGAELFASFFHDSRVAAVLKVQCWMVFITALSSVPDAILKRGFFHGKLIWATLMPNIALFAIAVPMAAYGYGYWALVFAALLGSAARFVMVWSKIDFRPRFSLDRVVTKRVAIFGGLVSVEALCGWALNYGDNAVLGHYLASKELGLYVFAYSIVMLIGTLVSSPVISVSYPLLCRVQKDTDEFRVTFRKGVTLLATVAFPVFMGLSLVADLVTTAFFGNRWEGLGSVLSILCIHPGLSYVLSLNPEIYKAKGRPDIMAKFQMFSMLYLIPVYLVSVHFGLIGFCIGRASCIVFWIPHTIIAARVLGIKTSFIFHCIKGPFFASMFMCIAISPLNFLTFENAGILGLPLTRLFLSVIVGAAVYLGFNYAFNRDFTKYAYNLMWRAIRSS
jgi:O-antigen/teichoic acid export membrane protein